MSKTKTHKPEKGESKKYERDEEAAMKKIKKGKGGY